MRLSNASAAVILTLSAMSAAACTTPLSVVQVNAPNVNCVFDPSCRLTVTDTVANLPPVPGYTGTAVLQSRTASVSPPGVPGSGTIPYIYRVDLTGAAPATDQMCVSSLAVNFGPIVQLPYSGVGNPNADVFVITTGGLGTIGLRSAEKTGNKITFRFSLASFPAPGDPFPPCLRRPSQLLFRPCLPQRACPDYSPGCHGGLRHEERGSALAHAMSGEAR
jgi:hypothetical protein